MTDAQEASENQPKKKILIVEDDPVLKNMYSQKLVNAGLDVVTAIDGLEAEEIFKKDKIDIILTDIMLPRVTGFEFMEKIKKTAKGKKVIIIAWSNLQDEETKTKALSLGAVEFLQKNSLSLEDVANTVKKYIR
jgi:DNA-binding response OmpR family regulator